MSVSNIVYPNGGHEVLNSNGLHIGNVSITNDGGSGTVTNTDLVNSINGLYCSIVRASVQSITNNTVTVISFNQVDLDNGDFFDISNPTYITIPSDGIYLFNCQGLWDANLAGDGFLYIYRGAIQIAPFTALPTTASALNQTGMGLSLLLACTAGDQMSFRVKQTSAGSKNILAWFSINKVGI